MSQIREKIIHFILIGQINSMHLYNVKIVIQTEEEETSEDEEEEEEGEEEEDLESSVQDSRVERGEEQEPRPKL